MAKEQKQQVELIRIMGTDLKANNTLMYGLANIKGINLMFSNAMCNVLKLDKNRKISSLSEKETEVIESFLSNPKKEGIPEWMLNSRRDLETGDNLHFIAKDIDFNLIQIKRRLGKLRTYKGLRHRAQLPLRGQRTKSNFRRNKTMAAKKAKQTGGKK
ncbi:MAG: 30S ribosomal protein S13 [Candidatus Woesearchaeota archaeon]|jgi:small subunit ribosomal protein S13|nr:30S ribosomal protein S13 [Candidatus Woesearchaeota archaeon]